METEMLITFAIPSIAFMLSLSSGCSNTIQFQSLPVHDQLAYTIHKVSTSSQSSHFPPSSIRNPRNTALKLVPRDIFSIHGKKSYWHLFQERLHLDSKRVAGLSLLHKNTSYTSLIYKLQDFRSPVVSGAEEGIGEYFVKVGIGSPPVYQYMVIDTGSDVTWVQCQPCKQCYPQADPIFDPASSASFKKVTCGSVACGLLDKTSECGSGPCQYEVTYEDGSYTKGILALETINFGSTEVQNVAIGCGNHNLGLFAWASGLLGLGGGVMSLVGQLGGQTGGAFGYCLASPGSESDGSLFFGRAASISTGTTWVPLVRNALNPSFYYIDLVGLGVGGVRVTVPEEVFQLSEYGDGGTILDTGTAVTRLPVAAYEVLRDGIRIWCHSCDGTRCHWLKMGDCNVMQGLNILLLGLVGPSVIDTMTPGCHHNYDTGYSSLRDAFVNATKGFRWADGLGMFDTCYDLAGFGTVRVPTVSFFFSNGPELILPAKNYLISVDGNGTFCLAFAPSASGLSILGNIQQKGIQISFDTVNGFVVFGPGTC